MFAEHLLCARLSVGMLVSLRSSWVVLFVCLLLLRATPSAYGSSQGRAGDWNYSCWPMP